MCLPSSTAHPDARGGVPPDACMRSSISPYPPDCTPARHMH